MSTKTRRNGPQLNRRMFLKGSAAAGAGLVIGFNLNCSSRPKVPVDPPAPGVAPPATEFVPNAFLRIAPDNSITVISKHIEFGQGTHTGLATIVAEELDADWSQIRVEPAPANPALYNNLLFGPVQATGGSTSMANSWKQLREAGASARAMLIAAAAEWSVPASEITAKSGRIMHNASGRSAAFGDLATRAGTMSVPESVTLKDPKAFSLIGTRVPRVDVASKSNGQAEFTLDVYLPDMLTAVLARPPRFGGKVESFDATLAKQVKGVVDVVQIPRGVAVVARGFWAAKKGRDALKITWNDSEAEKRSSGELWAKFKAMSRSAGKPVRQEGDAEKALSTAAKVIEAEFEYPLLAHAPMETLDCVAQVKDGQCEIWAGSQGTTFDQMGAARTLGIEPKNVKINTLFAGGSFGRRATPTADVVHEAVSLANALKTDKPIKLVWTREDDIRGGHYRPMFFHRLRGGLDAAGNIVGWHHRLIGQSIFKGTSMEFAMQNGVDPSMIEGAANLPYAVPNLHVDVQIAEVGVPVLWWRAVGHTHNAFSTEVFFDQLCRASGRDPYKARRALLAEHPRHLAALDLAATKAGWGTPLPRGKARGIAVHESFGSFVAQVAEISLDKRGLPVVERVVCAIDCGIAINPDIIRSQMEGGMGFGLSAALHNEITLDRGRVVQSNFHDYQPLRIHEMPKVDVHIVPSQAPPTGVGEPGLPPIAPAVANAYLELTGKPIHRLPFRHLITTRANPGPKR